MRVSKMKKFIVSVAVTPILGEPPTEGATVIAELAMWADNTEQAIFAARLLFGEAGPSKREYSAQVR